MDDPIISSDSPRLEALAAASQMLEASLPLEDMLRSTAEQARTMFSARLAAVSLVYDLGIEAPTTVVALAEKGSNERALARGLENFGMSVQICHAERPLHYSTAELENHPAWRGLTERLGATQPVHGWLAAPLHRGDGQCLGYIQVVGKESADFDGADSVMLAQLARVASLVIENQRLNHAEQQARQAAETLRVASLALTQELNLDDVLDTLLDYLSWIVPYDCASVLLLEPPDCLTVRAVRSYDSRSVAARQPGNASDLQENPVVRELIQTHKVVHVPDIQSQPEWDRRFGGENRSWLGLPLVTDDRVMGLCALEKSEPGFFTEVHQRLAEALAAQAAIAIENASLFERLSASEERYRAAAELTSDFAYAFRVDSEDRFTCEWVTDAFTRITGFACGEVDTQAGWSSLAHPNDAAVARQHLQTLLSGKPCASEYRIVTRSAEIRWLQDYSRPVLEANQRRVTRIFGAAQDITERKQKQRELEAVAGLASALRTALNRSEMTPVILDQALALVAADGAALARHDPASPETLIELGRGEWAGWAGVRQGAGDGITGRVVMSGQAYSSNHALGDPMRSRAEAIGDLQAIACVPLIAHEETIGALWLGRKTEISEPEIALTAAIADIAANALRRAALHEQTERRLQHISALRAIDRAITASLDLEVTLNVLLDQVTSQLEVHAAEILLYDAATQSLRFQAGRGFRSTDLARFQIRLGESYGGRAALERRVVRAPSQNETELAFPMAPWLSGEGFAACVCVPLVTKGQLKGVLDVFHRSPLDPDHEWLGFLETLAGQAAIAIENAQLFDGLQRTNLKLTQAYDATIEGWSRALELRDKETEGHSQRVTEMTLELARTMGMSETELVHVRRGALLHDIGKMGIPDAILLRPGPLTEPEWQIMRLHPKYAYDMLSPIGYLRPALDIPYCHHEKWDGSGYPRGLKGEQIPLAARIFAIADVWDALLSDRPYGQAWTHVKALAHVREQSGKYFDPKVVETFLRVFEARDL